MGVAIGAAVFIVGLLASVIAIWQVVWPLLKRRVLKHPEPPVVTVPELQKALQQLKDELKEEIPEVFNHKFAVARDSTATLVQQLPADRTELLRKATEAQSQARYREAIDFLQQCDYPGMPAGERATLHGLIGNSYLYLGEARSAEPEYAEALAAARQAKDRDTEGAVLGNLGIVHTQRGELEKAEEHHKQALEIAREIGDRLGEAKDLGNLGIVYGQRGGPGDLDKAAERFKQAVEIDREIGNRLGEARQLGNLGIVYRRRGELEKAEEHYQQALEIGREIGDRLGEANQLGNLGIVYGQRNGPGDLDKAEKHFKQALEIAGEIGNRLVEASQLANLGNVYRQRGDLSKAGEYLQQAQTIYQKIGAGGEGPEIAREALELVAELEREQQERGK
jgi:tetratricopeptide (TPR) repeat protein